MSHLRGLHKGSLLLRLLKAALKVVPELKLATWLENILETRLVSELWREIILECPWRSKYRETKYTDQTKYYTQSRQHGEKELDNIKWAPVVDKVLV